jgi:hypothetical protein
VNPLDAALLEIAALPNAALWAEGGRLHYQRVPRRLLPVLAEHKATLLALLALDDYDRQERAGIMEYDAELPRAEAERLAKIRPTETPETVESYPSTTQPPSVRPERDMGPSRVSCGTCLHFLPDYVNPSEGMGRCTVTPTGLPPRGGNGHGAPYPNAPRRCPEYLGT